MLNVKRAAIVTIDKDFLEQVLGLKSGNIVAVYDDPQVRGFQFIIEDASFPEVHLGEMYPRATLVGYKAYSEVKF